MHQSSSDVLELAATATPFEKTNTTDLVNPIKSGTQCGQQCPHNSSDHHGKCYLDASHTSSHKCSVDGVEFP